jgi:hypothetical protein
MGYRSYDETAHLWQGKGGRKRKAKVGDRVELLRSNQTGIPWRRKHWGHELDVAEAKNRNVTEDGLGDIRLMYRIHCATCGDDKWQMAQVFTVTSE